MNRSDPHFGLRPQRPTPEPVGRPSKSSAELQKDELQRKAAEEYARRGINRVYKQELEARQNELQQQGIHPPGELNTLEKLRLKLMNIIKSLPISW